MAVQNKKVSCNMPINSAAAVADCRQPILAPEL